MLKNKGNKLMAPILVVIMLVLVYVSTKYIFVPIFNRNQFADQMVKVADVNDETIFKISKVIKYSSAEAIDNSPAQNLQDLSIHQYSDIALYIENMGDELTEENTIKELYLDNFKIDLGYNSGTQSLYYKNPLEISKFRLISENEIKEKLEYQIIYTNEENENSNYQNPVFFTDCSNPITIGYINKDIVKNYKVTKEKGLVASDGRIFNNLNIDLEKLSPKISFTIHLKNNLDENFWCDMSVDLKLETDEGTVKSGYIIEIEEKNEKYKFFKEVNF